MNKLGNQTDKIILLDQELNVTWNITANGVLQRIRIQKRILTGNGRVLVTIYVNNYDIRMRNFDVKCFNVKFSTYMEENLSQLTKI